MTQHLSAGSLADLPPGNATVVVADRESIAVFNMGGTLYACSAACPHAGAPLQDGFVQGTRVTCPWHGWTFDLAQGPDAPPDGVIRYPVKVVDGEIVVSV